MAYEEGKGIAPDHAAAVEWLQKASAKGYRQADTWLTARGVTPNPPPRAAVSRPSVVTKRDPQYTEEARKSFLSGTVRIALVVGTDGVPKNMRVVGPLGFGLDQKAIEAVQTWRFQPGMKDGKPVNVAATVEVNFRLLPGKDGSIAGKDRWRPAQMVFEKPEEASGPLATSVSIPLKGQANASGSASFEFTVDPQGHASQIRVLHASDPQAADEIAKQLATWKFGYTDKADVPVGAVGRVRFILNAGDEDVAKPLFPQTR